MTPDPKRLATLSKASAARRYFSAAGDLSGLEDHNALIGHQHGIVNVQRIQSSAIVGGKVEDFGPAFFHQIHELLMMTRGPGQIRRAGVAEILPLFFNVVPATECFFGPLHNDTPEARHHALAAERRHCPETVGNRIAPRSAARVSGEPLNSPSGNFAWEAMLI